MYLEGNITRTPSGNMFMDYVMALPDSNHREDDMSVFLPPVLNLFYEDIACLYLAMILLEFYGQDQQDSDRYAVTRTLYDRCEAHALYIGLPVINVMKPVLF